MEGVLYMGQRKHRNGCLLRLLSLCASGGFVLLVGLFGLYYLSETPSVYSESESGSGLSSIYNGLSGRATQEASKEISSKWVQSNETEELEDTTRSQDTNSLQDSLPKEATKAESPQKATGHQETIQADTLSEQDEETTQKDTKSQEQSGAEQVVEGVETTPSETFEEVAIYDAYVLSLDEEIVDKMGDLYKDGQIDYQHVISKLFSKLSFSEQLRLLNMILSKVQTININEVWNMINDGIDEEESRKLQELVQANFTMEELDELYMYYQSIEIAENE